MRQSQDTPALESHRQNFDLRIDTPLSEQAPATPVLELRKITKRFGSILALSDASLVLGAGEVHALLGENGAGKSTMIKIMTGVHQPDSGDILLDGKRISIATSAQAQEQGIAAIYQEPMLFPDLSIAENIFISHRDRGQLTGWSQMNRRAEEILAALGVSLDVRAPARGLTLASQQSVEIAKAISLNVRVLIMDEPTASLSAHEVTQLFKLIEDLRAQGVAILFVSHRMDEVFSLSDRITVFRDGRYISTTPRAAVTPQHVITDMVGRDIDLFQPRPATAQGATLLSVQGLGREGVFSDINFDIRRGEVLGFAGLIGAGRTDVGLALFGIEPATSGTIMIDGNPAIIASPRDAMSLGIAYVSEDRRQLGLSMTQPIATNITLPVLSRYLNTFGLVRQSKENEAAEVYCKRLQVRTPSVGQAVGKLSGGNQQKVMLAKWLNTNPKLLILDEPTRGIDIGAKAEVHAIIAELAAAGIAIMLISSDLPEVLALSDRVLVMREGQQMSIIDRDAADQGVIMAAATGQDSTV